MSEIPPPAPVAPAPQRVAFWKKFLLLMAVLLLTMIVVVMLQPNEFRLQRSAVMNASPEAVFAQVNDFHNWEKWSPWAKLDPNMKVTYEGPATGVGASYSWVGNDEVGEGRMTILESVPNERIRIQLEFIKPFAASNITEFTFKPEGSQTAVTWAMSGHNNFLSKAFHLCFNMDKLVGADFEKGLTSLKGIVEPAPK